MSLIAVLALGIALIRWWPAPGPPQFEGPFSDRPSDRIDVKEIQQTSQSRERTPPPPAPLPPVVVPNDQIIEEKLEFGDASISVENPEDDERLQEGTAATTTASRQPDTNPRLFRAVQPEYPSAARKEDVRARVEITVRVSKSGRVQNATVLRRWRLSEDGNVHEVASLEYGLEEAALAAARRTRFRPAVHNDAPVESQTTITFEFGPSQR